MVYLSSWLLIEEEGKEVRLFWKIQFLEKEEEDSEVSEAAALEASLQKHTREVTFQSMNKKIILHEAYTHLPFKMRKLLLLFLWNEF